MQPNPKSATPLELALIPVLQDNYIAVLWRDGLAAVVDPAVAEPVIAWLEQRHLNLVAVLQTHHHSDHIGGTPALLRRWPTAEVVASGADRERIPFQTRSVAEGDHFQLLGRSVEVLEVPGHTRCHLAFHLPAQAGEGAELFCGDTLFAGGCGRLFEGTPEQMHQALQRLTAFDPSTRVWCAHEYTESNLRWAAAEEPDNAAIAARLAAVRQQRARGEATIPSSIALERATNLFVRSPDASELARLRASKNTYRG
ncbi:MAG: hydroxyacylglutathione hydrolase [Synechococcaceae cyanobacterium ELA263]